MNSEKGITVTQNSKNTNTARAEITRALADWHRARLLKLKTDRDEHPTITDRFGRVWTWVSRDLYQHDNTMAWPRQMIEEARSLPSPALAGNPNYAQLCSICTSQWGQS